MEEKNLRRDDRVLSDEEGHPPVFTKPFKVTWFSYCDCFLS